MFSSQESTRTRKPKKGGRKHLISTRFIKVRNTKKGPGNQHCSDLSATLPLSRFQRQLPSERGAEENYLETLNLNVFVFFVSLCFQGFQRLAFCAYTLLTLYFLVLIQLYTRKRPARQAERLM